MIARFMDWIWGKIAVGFITAGFMIYLTPTMIGKTWQLLTTTELLFLIILYYILGSMISFVLIVFWKFGARREFKSEMTRTQ